jgi:hypothetical protein
LRQLSVKFAQNRLATFQSLSLKWSILRLFPQ